MKVKILDGSGREGKFKGYAGPYALVDVKGSIVEVARDKIETKSSSKDSKKQSEA